MDYLRFGQAQAGFIWLLFSSWRHITQALLSMDLFLSTTHQWIHRIHLDPPGTGGTGAGMVTKSFHLRKARWYTTVVLIAFEERTVDCRLLVSLGIELSGSKFWSPRNKQERNISQRKSKIKKENVRSTEKKEEEMQAKEPGEGNSQIERKEEGH